MDFSKLLENKNLLYGIIGVVALIVVAIIMSIAISVSSGGGNKSNVVGGEPLKANVDLLTTDSIGKALEIQALLAKQGITVERSLDGTKSKLFLNKDNCSTLTKKCTITDRDKAIIAIVQSGLVDQNVGLEIFDKGDFTSTKEDKRIRLSRAMNGELARLIKQIPPIQNATVFISIPDNGSMFEDKKPQTATVQLVMPTGEKLDNLKVKAISNLMLGSIPGLKAENLAITDTNGNVYNSILDATDEMLQRIEENDKYMQQKVSKQLDRLIGPGNYVVTVSTFLRQTPVEKFSIEYDPNRKTSVTEQSFTEGLGDDSKDNSSGGNPVSVYLPNGVGNITGGSNSSQSRNYSRQATETQYGVTKTQTNEYIKPGVVEDISIAVTLDRNNLPSGEITVDQLKELIARAASPKVTAANVSIAFTNSADPYLTPDKQPNLPKVDETGNPWWLALLIVGAALIIIFNAVSGKVQQLKEENEVEVEALRKKTLEQEQQLNEINSRASQLTQRQSELAQDLMHQQQIQQQQRVPIPQFDESLISDSLENLSNQITEDAAESLRSWIEEAPHESAPKVVKAHSGRPNPQITPPENQDEQE